MTNDTYSEKSVTTLAACLAVAHLFLGLAACSGGDTEGGTVIGAAGGTVSGPNGAQVVIPPGALPADTTINIAQTSAGAPGFPAGFSASGPMYALTPHGIQFALPVTLTLPFDRASVPAGTAPRLYKTNAGNQWERIADVVVDAGSVSGQVATFSWSQLSSPLMRNDPMREWTFSEYRGRSMTKVDLVSETQQGGLFQRFNNFGAVFPSAELLDHEITSLTGDIIPADGIATGQVFSSESGETYGAFTEAPYGNPNLPDSPAGSTALLRQSQSFIKRTADASLSFTLTGAFIDLRDDNGGFKNTSTDNPKCVYPPGVVASLDACQDIMKGQLIFAVQAYTGATPTTAGKTFYSTAGVATMLGHRGHWSVEVSQSMLSRTPLWSLEDFQLDVSPRANLAVLIFKKSRTYEIDLSGIEVGQEFTLASSAFAEATNRQGNIGRGLREAPSAASAFLRDPLTIGGTTLVTAGLEPTNNPVPVAPAETPVDPASCLPGPGPDPEAGVLQFSAASYSVEELGGAVQPVRIVRTGGSRGAVTATFTTSDGTALAGTDYTPVIATVYFGDGDTEARTAHVPIIQDLISGQPARTVNLTLSQPGGCAALGTPIAAVLTIEDDDLPPPPPTFTIGGTVTGLVGTGLELLDSQSLTIRPGNGVFTSKIPLASGSRYTVTIAALPTNPIQECTVTNGTGTVANADVTDIAVNCLTPATTGTLDPAFGAAGKVSTAFGGSDTAMALQADGKIVMAGGSSSDFILARYNADGNLDASFGAGGLVTTDLGGLADKAHGLALQPDAKIVVVGKASKDFALARYNADGSLDTTFGTGGKVTTDFNGQTDIAYAVAVQSDGKIVVVGDVGFSSPTGPFRDFGVARYDSNGALDVTFGNGGKVTTDIGGGTDIARNVVLQPNGAILVSGPRTLAGASILEHAGLARYRADGSLDETFGAGGKVALRDSRVGDGLALQGDAIVITGSVAVGMFPARSYQFALMRLSANGSPDAGFGNGGLVLTPFTTQDDFGQAVAVQADGKILVAGQSSNRSNSDFAVARYEKDGMLDASFGTAGKVTIDFFSASDSATDVAVQPDGKIVLGGSATNVLRTGYALARVSP